MNYSLIYDIFRIMKERNTDLYRISLVEVKKMKQSNITFEAPVQSYLNQHREIESLVYNAPYMCKSFNSRREMLGFMEKIRSSEKNEYGGSVIKNESEFILLYKKSDSRTEAYIPGVKTLPTSWHTHTEAGIQVNNRKQSNAGWRRWVFLSKRVMDLSNQLISKQSNVEDNYIGYPSIGDLEFFASNEHSEDYISVPGQLITLHNNKIVLDSPIDRFNKKVKNKPTERMRRIKKSFDKQSGKSFLKRAYNNVNNYYIIDFEDKIDLVLKFKEMLNEVGEEKYTRENWTLIFNKIGLPFTLEDIYAKSIE